MDDTQIQLSPDDSFPDDLLNLSADNSFLDDVQNLFLDDIQKFFDESTDYVVESETNPPQDSTQDHPALPAIEDYLRMDDTQIQLSPDDSFPGDLLNLSADNSFLDDVQNLSLDNIFLDDIEKFFDESTDYDYAVEFETNPLQDSTQDHPVLPEEPVEDSIPMDGGVPPLPSTGRDELTTNPQTDSAHRHHIIPDPIFETFFKRHDESPRSPTCDVLPLPNNLSDSVESSKPTPHPTQQHPPPTSQSLEVPVSTFQPLQNISNKQFVHTQLYQPKPTPLQSPTPPNKRQKISSKRCGCKVNKCQKRHCGCYAAGELCGENCSCQGCCNKSEYEATEKRNNNMGHNPQAMYGAPTLNPFAPSSAVNIASMARRQANSFTTSSNISPPQAVQMTMMAQQEANSSTTSSNISLPQTVQTAMMAQQQANSFTTSSNISPPQTVQMATISQANPFVPSRNIFPPQAVQMATIAQANPFVPSSNISPPQAFQMAFMAQPQASPFATSSNISPLPAVSMAAMASSRANPSTTYQPQAANKSWDCSEEILECFRVQKYDIEAECLPKPAERQRSSSDLYGCIRVLISDTIYSLYVLLARLKALSNFLSNNETSLKMMKIWVYAWLNCGRRQREGYNRTRDLDSEELLVQLPALLQLLYRLVGCRFFEMPRLEAITAFDVYKRAGQQEEPVEDSIPMDGGVSPLPSIGRDELTTNPQTDSAHRHDIILDPIFETFFKRHDESLRSPTFEDNLSDSVDPSKPTSQSLDGGVLPLPSTGKDELTTNPQTDSAHRHHIILDPIFETFFTRHDELPRSPTCDVLPLQDNMSNSVESSKPTPHSTQQHPPPTSQSFEVPVATFQPLQNISNQQHVHAQLYQPKPAPLQSPTPPNKRQKISSKRCGCKVNKCQKRHCGCYAAGELCGENCSCQGCCNKSEYEATEKRNTNMGHNPQEMHGAPTLNPFAPSSAVNIASMACRQENSFTTSSNISPPQAVQMTMMAQQQANSSTTSSNISLPQTVQTAMMAQQQANSFTTSSNISPPQTVQMATIAQANPFVPSSNISPPQAFQMAFMAQPQASPFATSSNISPLPAVSMAAMASSRANPSTTYQPQQQQMLMNPTNQQRIPPRFVVRHKA
ncbi:hypothetical protein K1719_002585 [Acacia pycnantha]|nr:hypothetical protein K1719_002585 [Acacia pycnantha]